MGVMEKVILFANPKRDPELRQLDRVRAIAGSLGIECAVGSLPCELDVLARGAELAVTFGGDGAILRAARALCGMDIPILGINLGHKGFMAELEAGEVELARTVFEGRYTLESRMMADVTVFRDGRCVYRDFALNEAVVGGVSRVIGLGVYGDGRRIMGFDGDGVIVSTPTGSTAYSLSAGGPIVEPTAQSLIVTPVCPHILSARSYVLAPERTVTVELQRLGNKTAYLSVDGGESVPLRDLDRIEVRRSATVTRLVRVTGRSFYEIVSSKLGE